MPEPQVVRPLLPSRCCRAAAIAPSAALRRGAGHSRQGGHADERAPAHPQGRRLIYGGLLARGYEVYWTRDLPAVRQIFRIVMKHGNGTLRDWKYMLPALLPEDWHRALIMRMTRQQGPRGGDI